MLKKYNYLFHFTSNVDGNNTIYKKIIEGESEKIAIKRFEKSYTNCNVLCITKL